MLHDKAASCVSGTTLLCEIGLNLLSKFVSWVHAQNSKLAASAPVVGDN